MSINTCCIVGDLVYPRSGFLAERLEMRISDTIEQLVKYHGTKEFVSAGGYGFEMLAARAVILNKARFEGIKLLVMPPYKGFDERWPELMKLRNRIILEGADSVEYYAEKFVAGCVFDNHLKMADRSQICIAYSAKKEGLAQATQQHLKQKNTQIINLSTQ